MDETKEQEAVEVTPGAVPQEATPETPETPAEPEEEEESSEEEDLE